MLFTDANIAIFGNKICRNAILLEMLYWPKIYTGSLRAKGTAELEVLPFPPLNYIYFNINLYCINKNVITQKHQIIIFFGLFICSKYKHSSFSFDLRMQIPCVPFKTVLFCFVTWSVSDLTRESINSLYIYLYVDNVICTNCICCGKNKW